ncbi:P-loop containing nucleoside triphosphate hydrolase protein [Phakopsora pachyrhizi]|uniref:ATP-dependent RNA helicase n=1 Tax=Phakopsora pachyrhizi TaxID=170000 RepID=A0AAV0BH93_PHAPC|nr:P-loop containing nucleoside triphosphate hydrolase protein [Phakopsora pachyrhizi]
MFSVRRFDPTSSTSASAKVGEARPEGDTRNSNHTDPLSRLNARLAARRDINSDVPISDSKSQQVPVELAPEPTSGIINIDAQCEEENSTSKIEPQHPEAPITRKHKARLELGFTGANAIPLLTLDSTKPKTKAKLKYLKRKKQRCKERKKKSAQAEKSKKNTQPRECGLNDVVSADISGKETSKSKNLEILRESPDKSSITKKSTNNIVPELDTSTTEKTNPRKRPKNLDETLQNISKKRKNDIALSAVDSEKHDAKENLLKNNEITQPGALPRFPAPVNPSPPDLKVLSRLSMGVTEHEDDMIQIDSQSRLDLSEVKIRGEALGDTESIKLSSHSLQRLKNLNIQSLLAVQAAVFSILLNPIAKTSYPSASILHPTRAPPRDICVSAPTGSGKTLSYVLPIVEVSNKQRYFPFPLFWFISLMNLFLYQVSFLSCRNQVTGFNFVTGQHSFSQEQSAIKGPGGCSEGGVDVVIATPGRLLDHLDHTPSFSLEHLCFLVLDEADQLLSKSQAWIKQVLFPKIPSHLLSQPAKDPEANGFLKPGAISQTTLPTKNNIRRWNVPIEALNPCRQRPFRILLFSATLQRDPTKLSHLNLRRPVYLKISQKLEGAIEEINIYNLPDTLIVSVLWLKIMVKSYLYILLMLFYKKQKMVVTTTMLKPLVLFHLINTQKIKHALCFCKSVEGATRLASLYKFMNEACDSDQGEVRKSVELGNAACFSSDLPANDRRKMLTEFETGKIDLLICSDLIARGLDVPTVKHVINYDSPVDAKKYVHRVGRTARAGEVGTAWSLVESQEAKFLKSSLKSSIGGNAYLEYLIPSYEISLKKLSEVFGRYSFDYDS